MFRNLLPSYPNILLISLNNQAIELQSYYNDQFSDHKIRQFNIIYYQDFKIDINQLVLIIYLPFKDCNINKLIVQLPRSLPLIVISTEIMQISHLINIHYIQMLDLTTIQLFDKTHNIIQQFLHDQINQENSLVQLNYKICNLILKTHIPLFSYALDLQEYHNINFTSALIVTVEISLLKDISRQILDLKKSVLELLYQLHLLQKEMLKNDISYISKKELYITSKLITDLHLPNFQKQVLRIYQHIDWTVENKQIVISNKLDVQNIQVSSPSLVKQAQQTENILIEINEIFNLLVKNYHFQQQSQDQLYYLQIILTIFVIDIMNSFKLIFNSIKEYQQQNNTLIELDTDFPILHLLHIFSKNFTNIECHSLLNCIKISKFLFQIENQMDDKQDFHLFNKSLLSSQYHILTLLKRVNSANQVAFLLGTLNFFTEKSSNPSTPRSTLGNTRPKFPIDKIFLGQKIILECYDQNVQLKPKECGSYINDQLIMHPLSNTTIQVLYFGINYEINVIQPFEYQVQILPINYYILRNQGLEQVYFDRAIIKICVQPIVITEYLIKRISPTGFNFEGKDNFYIKTKQKFIDFYYIKKKEQNLTQKDSKVAQIDYQFQDITGSFPIFTPISQTSSNAFQFTSNLENLKLGIQFDAIVTLTGIGLYDLEIITQTKIIGKLNFSGFSPKSVQFCFSVIPIDNYIKISLIGKLKTDKKQYELEYCLFDGKIQ
uniref:Uncharacterized protein n=1 Tax=Spironucleus salmonicida TaxID=348837 RepID=V6LCB2_9EUKA|eukprot:EST41873.1 Hypothetical protein SS50377_18709 [Spironucleus salmonicida]